MNDDPDSIPAVGSGNRESLRARGAALRLLAAKPRSVAEMRERLGHRFAKDVVEQTVAHLVREGLLNDEQFAQQWRQSRERRKPRSRRMIAQELKQRGVADDVISDALQDFDSSDAAYRSVVKYANRQDRSNRATFDRRVSAFLGRRGFEPGIIRQTLTRLREELAVGSPVSPEMADC